MDLIEKDGVCSAASRRGRYRQEVTVGRHTTRSVPFVVIPMKEGQLEIEVKAAVRGMGIGDGVMKKLLVVVRETESVWNLVNLIKMVLLLWCSY